jgi:hypothetical protein
MTQIHHVLIATLVATVAACGGTSRNVAVYRADTANLLESRSAELRTCYENALVTDTSLAGTVTVQFVVRPDSGRIENPTIDPTRSTATPALGECVITAINGLVLAPPDRNEGRATYTYEFRPDATPTAVPASS